MTYERERVRHIWGAGEAKQLVDPASLCRPSRELGSEGFQSAVSVLAEVTGLSIPSAQSPKAGQPGEHVTSGQRLSAAEAHGRAAR